MTKLVYNKNFVRKKFVHFVAPLFIATSSTDFLYFVAFPFFYCNNSKFCGIMNTFFALNWIAYNLWLNWFTIRIWKGKKKFISYHLCLLQQMPHTFLIIAFVSFHYKNSEFYSIMNIFFIIVCLRFLLSHVFFLLLLLSTSQIQICFMTFYFSQFIAGLLFQLLFNYLHVTGSLNTTFLLSHWSYRCTFIFKLGLILYAFFIAIFVFSILCVICFKSMRIFSCVHVSSISWLGFLFDFLFFHGIFISFPFIFSILTMLLKLPWLTIFDNLNLSFNF